MNITDFLISVRGYTREGKLVIIPTQKNRETRRFLGLTILDLEDIICNIKESDLKKGPVLDRDRPGEYLFVFKPLYGENLLYVKLKLEPNQAKCISLHIDDI